MEKIAKPPCGLPFNTFSDVHIDDTPLAQKALLTVDKYVKHSPITTSLATIIHHIVHIGR